MSVFESTTQLYSVLDDVFKTVSNNPESISAFTHSNLVIRIRFDNPSGELLVDGRQPPLEVFYGERPGKANLEIAMDGDLLHRIWNSEVSTSQAFFSGQIKTKGNIMKAMRLVDLFRACEQVYPHVAARHGLA